AIRVREALPTRPGSFARPLAWGEVSPPTEASAGETNELGKLAAHRVPDPYQNVRGPLGLAIPPSRPNVGVKSLHDTSRQPAPTAREPRGGSSPLIRIAEVSGFRARSTTSSSRSSNDRAEVRLRVRGGKTGAGLEPRGREAPCISRRNARESQRRGCGLSSRPVSSPPPSPSLAERGPRTPPGPPR